MSSLDSARFKSIPESDEITKDEQPLEPTISIFDLIENEKAKEGIKNALVLHLSYILGPRQTQLNSPGTIVPSGDA